MKAIAIKLGVRTVALSGRPRSIMQECHQPGEIGADAARYLHRDRPVDAWIGMGMQVAGRLGQSPQFFLTTMLVALVVSVYPAVKLENDPVSEPNVRAV